MDIPKGFAPDIKDEQHLQYLLRGPEKIQIPIVYSVDEFPEATNLFCADGKLFLVADSYCELDIEENLDKYIRRCGTQIREYKPKHLKPKHLKRTYN